jgi:hypothetical protein
LASSNLNHKPDKNDYLDSLQLIYLADPQMHFVTCEKRYRKRIKSSSQLSRIHEVPVLELTDAMRAQAILAKIVFPNA